MLCEQERRCFACGYHTYDSFHDENNCSHPEQPQQCPMSGHGSCEHWVCSYIKLSQELEGQIVTMTTDLKNARKLYEAEKLLRLEAEQ